MSSKTVLLVGWHPDSVDYSQWPGLNAEKLRAALEGDRDRLRELGYDASLGFIHDEKTAPEAVTKLLTSSTYDCVLIGAGVRTVDQHFIVFEQLVNAVHRHAPNAHICFNTGPTDSVDAVQRWV